VVDRVVGGCHNSGRWYVGRCSAIEPGVWRGHGVGQPSPAARQAVGWGLPLHSPPGTTEHRLAMAAFLPTTLKLPHLTMLCLLLGMRSCSAGGLRGDRNPDVLKD